MAIRGWIVCVGVACTSVAVAAPKVDASEQYKVAAQHDDKGDYDKALAVIGEGLAIAPEDLRLLGLKGTVLLKLRDYAGALTTYQAYLEAGATGANRREAEKIVQNLLAVKSTFLDITLANGPAPIYLDSKTQGVFCTAAPSCKQGVLPGVYKVIVERSGFERWTSDVTIVNGNTAQLAITLVEKPSLLTVRVTQPGARITIDDKPYDAPLPVAGGTHQVVVSLAGHAEMRREVAAHEGQPVELDIALAPLVPFHIEPPGAQLLLDDKPIAIVEGGIAIPPGTHVLVARAQGFQDHRLEIPAGRASDYKLDITLARIEARPEVARVGRRSKRPPALPIVMGTAALAFGGGAFAFSRWGDSIYDDANHEPDDAKQEALWKSANKRRYAAIGFSAAAVGYVGAAIYLYVRGGREKPQPLARRTIHVAPTASASTMGLSLDGAW